MSDPNPYDQFDTEQGNPYDQFDAKSAPDYSWHAAPARDPTEGMSTYDKVMAGAGKAPVDLWNGVRQLFGDKTAQADIDNAAERDKALLKTGAGLAGNIGGDVAMAVLPAGLASAGLKAAGMTGAAGALGAVANPTTFGAAAASGALQGATAPVESGGSRLWNTVAGGALGAGGTAIARGATNLVAPAADAAGKAVQALTNAGVPLDAAQRTGSMLLARAKAMLSDNPLTAGAQADFQDMQSKQFTKAVLSTFGENAPAATPKVMGDAMKRMGAVYDDIASRTSIPYDDIEPKLVDIENQARLTLNDSQFGVVQRNLNDILQKASQNNGHINGEQFSNLKKTLDTLSGGSDSDVGEVARDIRQTLHQGLLDSAAANGNQADVLMLQKTNQQWGNMRKVESAISKDGDGQISPARLANVMYQKANRYTSIYGKGDTSLTDLANAGNSLLGNKTPNSGTPARLIAQSILPLAGAGIGASASPEDRWKNAAEGAAVGYAIPKLIQKGINSQGAFGNLTQGIAGLAQKPTSKALVVPGAIQHAPLSSLLAVQQRLAKPDTSKKEQDSNQ